MKLSKEDIKTIKKLCENSTKMLRFISQVQTAFQEFTKEPLVCEGKSDTVLSILKTEAILNRENALIGLGIKYGKNGETE